MEALAKIQKCILLKNGIEKWVELDIAEQIQDALDTLQSHLFIRIADSKNETVNTAELVGVFGADTLEEFKRAKNGQYKCLMGTWHDKGQICACVSFDVSLKNKAMEICFKECGKCAGGFISQGNNTVRCKCLNEFESKINYYLAKAQKYVES
jgi:hypothetical protein